MILSVRNYQNVFRLLEFLNPEQPVDTIPCSDAIFTFGSSNRRIPEHAAELYKIGKAPIVIATGHKGWSETAKPPEGFQTEADFFASVMRDIGVPFENIVREFSSQNTPQNAEWGIKRARDLGYQIQSVILCTRPTHLRRCLATFEKVHPNITVYGSPYPDRETDVVSEDLIKRIIREFDKIVKYYKKGDIAPVVISDEVQQAVAALKKDFPSM